MGRAVAPFWGWSDYGQVVLQMAMLDTLLSIEELLMDEPKGEP